MEYFGLKLGQDLGNRAAHPYQIFRGVSPPPPPGFYCFRCKLLDNRTINWTALFGFLLEPFPYSIIHTVTLLRTGKSSSPLLQESSVSECYLLVFFHNRIFQQVCVLLSILCYSRIVLRFENVFLKVICSLLSALFYLLE